MQVIPTVFSCNAVVWITSLFAQEMEATERMVSAMEQHSRNLKFWFEHVRVRTLAELNDFLDNVVSRARDRGLRPILHLDTHGDEAKGLEIRPEQTFIGWDDLGKKLQCINVHTHNNLAVVGATCFGLQAIKSVSLDKPAPFFLLLAPPKKVFEPFLEEHIPAFYRSVFESQPVNEAHLQHLAPEFRYFHCEEMLFIVIALYIKQQCLGKGGAERRERLLTEVFSQGAENTPENRKRFRAMIRQGTKPTQALVDRYAQRFLMGRPCSFTIEQLLDAVGA